MNKLELIIDAKAILGEGPSWDSQSELLYWVDIIGKKVHIYDPKSNTDRYINTDQYVSAVVPSNSGKLILAMQHGFHTLDLNTEKLTKINDPESNIPGNRFNDGKCDATGRFWAGTMDINENDNQGALYCLLNDQSVRTVLNEVSISNGIAWDKDNRMMYFIDTPTKQVVAFDFDLFSGEISNKRVVVKFKDGEGSPDGMSIDTEGMLWIAHWGGYQISRWDPKKGVKLDSISLPVAKVTSCVFGGLNLDELYITTASIDLDSEEQINQPHAGGVFRVKTGIKGVRTYNYGG